MKKVRVTTTVLAMAFMSLTAMSCNNSKKVQNDAQDNNSAMNHDGSNSEMNHNNMSASNVDSQTQNPDVKQVLADYMMLKDALVATNKDDAAKAGKKLESTLNGFNVSSYTSEQQKELKDIISDAKEHAEHIGKSEIDHQREHFKSLSKDIMDMVAITGTDTTLYQQFCPMYDKGSAWLSMSKDIKNPYYGSKMMTCGRVEKEIN